MSDLSKKLDLVLATAGDEVLMQLLGLFNDLERGINGDEHGYDARRITDVLGGIISRAVTELPPVLVKMLAEEIKGFPPFLETPCPNPGIDLELKKLAEALKLVEDT